MRTRLFFGEALRSATANLSTTIAATMTVLIGMFVLGLFIALGSWVISWTDHVKEDVVAKVFFDPKAERGQIEAVRTRLSARPDVKSITDVTKEEALEIMKKRAPELTRNLPYNPFGYALTVTPKRAEDVRRIAESLEPLPAGVDKVDYQEKTTERVLQVVKVIGLIFLIGSIVLLIASTLLISNTIRLSIFSRRREIEVMKLVGATNWFVRGPFMLEGILCGLAGSFAAVLLLLLAKELALPAIPALDRAGDEANAVSFPQMALILVILSLLVGAAGSGITLRRFLRI